MLSDPALEVKLSDDTVGAVGSTVTSRAVAETWVSVTPSSVVVADARMAYVPADRVPVVHDHSPVMEFAVHVDPVFVQTPLEVPVPWDAVAS